MMKNKLATLLAQIRNRWPLALGVLVVILSFAMWQWNTPPATTANKKSAKAVLTVTVRPPDVQMIPRRLEASGNISAWQEAFINADSAGLRLIDVRVNVGDRVKKGDLLARLDPRTPAAEAAQAQALLAQATATANTANSEAERARSLQNAGFYSQALADQALRQQHIARAQRQSAQAALTAAQIRLAQTEVRAPDDGVISARFATLGATTNLGQELFRLIRQGRLEWRAELTLKDAAQLQPGVIANLRIEGFAAPIQGRLRIIAPSADPLTRNVLAYVDLPHIDKLSVGSFAQGIFELPGAQGMALPQQAVVMRDGFSFVFVIDDQNIVHQRKVSIGEHFGGQVEIISGIMATESVVTQGAGFLNSGDLVKVVAQ